MAALPPGAAVISHPVAMSVIETPSDARSIVRTLWFGSIVHPAESHLLEATMTLSSEAR